MSKMDFNMELFEKLAKLYEIEYETNSNNPGVFYNDVEISYDYYKYIGMKMSNKNKFDTIVEIVAYDNKDKFYVVNYSVEHSHYDRIGSARWIDVNEIINNYVQI